MNPQPATHATGLPHTDSGLAETLAGLNASASSIIVQRTRRAVLDAANDLRERRSRGRRNGAIVVLSIAVLAMVLTPAIWSGVDDFLGGEQFFETPGMVMVLVVLLFSTILAALVVGLRKQDHLRAGRR